MTVTMQLKIQPQYLKQLLRTHSIKFAPPDKPFKLASGGTSLVFCDVKQTILQPEGAHAAAEMLIERIHDFEQEHETVIDAVAGVVLGGCAIASAVSNFGYVLGRRYSVLYVRKEPKDHGTEKLIEGEVRSRMNVALLEDVSTTGGSALKVMKVLEAAGANVPLVLSIVDRSGGAAAKAFSLSELNRMVEFDALYELDELVK